MQVGLISGLAGAGTELMRHGLTPLGFIAATTAGINGGLYGEMVNSEQNLDTIALLKMIGTSLTINLVCNGVIHLLASQITLARSIFFVVASAVVVLSLPTDKNYENITKCVSAGATICAVVGAELAALVASKTLIVGSSLPILGLGFVGTSVALLVGTIARYTSQPRPAST